MLANPFVLVVAALAAVTAGLYMYSKKMDAEIAARKKAMQDLAKDLLDFNGMFANIGGTDEVSVFGKQVQTSIDRGDESKLVDLQEQAAVKAEALRRKAEEAKQAYAGMVEFNGYGGQNFSEDEIAAQKQKVTETAEEWKKWLGIVEATGEAINNIGGANGKQDIPKPGVDLTSPDQSKIDELAERRKAFERKQAEDKIGEPVKKLELKRENLIKDRAAVFGPTTEEADLRRQSITEEIYAIEQEISAEKKKQADAQKELADQEAKAAADKAAKDKKAFQDKLDADKKAAMEKAAADKANDKYRETGKTAIGWHVGARSGETRRMENSMGMLSGLKPSSFHSWRTKDGGPKEEMQKVEIGGEAVTLLRGINKKLE